MPTTHVHPSTSRRRIAAVLTAMSLLAAACGGDDEPVVDSVPATEVEAIVIATAGAPSTSAEIPAVEPDRSGLRVVTLPMLGGLRLGIEPDVLLSTEGDYLTLRRAGDDGHALIARVSATASGPAVESVEQLLEQIDPGGIATVTPGTESITVVGVELDAFEMRGEPPAPNGGIFASRPPGFGSNVFWSPAPMADLALGTVTGGVLAVGAIAQSAGGLAIANELIAEVIPTMSLTTVDGAVAGLPNPVDFPKMLGELEPFVPATPDAEGPPVLAAPFVPIEAGQHQLTNLSTLVTIDVDPGWFMAPNFPTFIVITELPIVGPGFRDIVFHQRPTSIVGTNLGPTVNTPEQELGDVASFIAAPPKNLLITNVVEDTTFGGVAAVQFDMRVDPDATCQPNDPCSFAMNGVAADYAKFITAGAIHRTWWIDDAVGGPLVITAAAAEADTDWFETRLADFVAAINLG